RRTARYAAAQAGRYWHGGLMSDTVPRDFRAPERYGIPCRAEEPIECVGLPNPQRSPVRREWRAGEKLRRSPRSRRHSTVEGRPRVLVLRKALRTGIRAGATRN